MIKHILKKDKDFVQIPNSILTNPDISLKAKGIIALMLSLPNNWNFSIEGIASKCKESKDCISKAIKELESARYIRRTMMRGTDGKITKMEYEIFEQPYDVAESKENNENPCTEEPSAEKPSMDLPWQENTEVNNININKTKNNNTQSISISSNRNVSFNVMEPDLCRKVIMGNIDYDTLVQNNPTYRDMIDEIVELMTETVCLKKENITIASNIYPTQLVKSKFLKIDSQHIEYVIECMSKNTTKIGNIKQYLLAAIFNAPSTISSYYTAKVNNELYGF